jgi:glycosyltransferase involved in cell wall biosynthesis
MNIHSFGILAYQDSPYLKDCIESLINQSVKSYIYISTSTPSEYIDTIAKKYGLDIFINESHENAVHDVNFALSCAKSKYVTLAHQDDLYLPNYTESCLEEVRKFNDTLICFTNYSEIMDGKDRKVNSLIMVKRLLLSFFMPFSSNLKRKFWKKLMLSFGNPISAPTVIFNLEKLNNFQYDAESKFYDCLEWATWFDMAQIEGRFIYIKKILLKRRIHSESTTSIGLKDNSRFNGDLMMFKKLWPWPIANLLAQLYSLAYKTNKN